MPEKKFRQMLLEQLDPKPDEKILEFGFGTGQNLLLTKIKYPQTDLRGLDIDPKVRDLANIKLNKNGVYVPLDLYEGNDFPYPTSRFDKVFSCLVFHQLETDVKLACFQEIHRILRRDGQLLIADWGKAANLRMRLAFGLVQMLDGFKTTNDNVLGKMPDIMQKAGFRNIEIIDSINTAIGTFSYLRAIK